MKLLKRFFLRHRPPLSQKGPVHTIEPALSSNPLLNNIDVSKLERLPFDIRHEILLAVDTIKDMHQFVEASPTYYRQYHSRRDFWLWRCLWLELGHAVVDAYAASLCSKPGFQRKRTHQLVRDFIDDYKTQRSTPMEELFSLLISEEITSMVAFHSLTVRPVLQEYVKWTHSNLEAISTPEKLSKTEEKRILRGLYRFQIFCKLFGCSRGKEGPRFLPEEIQGLFVTIHEPWETEEILCINAFADATYKRVLDEIEWDLHPDNPRFDPVRMDLYTPPGAFHLCLFPDEYNNGLASSGLKLLHAALKLRDRSVLVELISKHLVVQFSNTIREATDDVVQDRMRDRALSDRDRATKRRDDMPFEGEREELPSKPWVTIWQGTYSNLYNNAIYFHFSDWGFIMWDADRLDKSGATGMLDQTWRALWTDEYNEFRDPRDYIF